MPPRKRPSVGPCWCSCQTRRNPGPRRRRSLLLRRQRLPELSLPASTPPLLVAPPRPDGTATPPVIDWQREAEEASHKQALAAEAQRDQKASGPSKAKPEFGWDRSRVHRVEPIESGGFVVRLNDRCVLVITLWRCPPARSAPSLRAAICSSTWTMRPRRVTGRTPSDRVACAPMTLPEAAALPLAEWESFYVIIGGSAAALTGLMFVVIAVVADAGPRAATPLGISGFVTPTIIHFCAALLISAILSAPWPGHHFVQLALGLMGFGGILYTLAVWRRIRRMTTYTMVFEDWAWHVILPLFAYAVTVASALTVEHETVFALSSSAAPPCCCCSSASTMRGIRRPISPCNAFSASRKSRENSPRGGSIRRHREPAAALFSFRVCAVPRPRSSFHWDRGRALWRRLMKKFCAIYLVHPPAARSGPSWTKRRASSASNRA